MKTSLLKLNPDNPRTITEEDFEKLKNSIKGFEKMMEINPIVIDEDNVILSGNQRYQALVAMEYKEIPDKWIKKVEGLTKAEKRKYVVQDNTHYGQFDMEVLANEYEVEELQEMGVREVANIKIDEIPPDDEKEKKKEMITCPLCDKEFEGKIASKRFIE